MLKFAPNTTRRYLSANGTAYAIDPDGLPPGAYLLQPKAHSSLPQLIGDIVEDTRFIGFLGNLLTMDPEKRPAVKQALQHNWLQMHTHGHSPTGVESQL